MTLAQTHLKDVEDKLNQQNALKAALLIPLYTLLILIFWYWIYHQYSYATSIILALSGLMIGSLVRFHGQGYTALFSVIAWISHFLLVLFAVLLGLVLGEGQSTRLFILVGLYLLGAWLAAYMARKNVPSFERQAFFELTEKQTHPSKKFAKNKSYLTLPITFVLNAILLYAVSTFLFVFTFVKAENDQAIALEQEQQRFEDKAIDVSPSNLASIDYAESLRHAYAYFSGTLPNQYGTIISIYPVSEYKSHAILKYHIKKNEDPRAKFILGILTYEDGGLSLIQEAAKDGDIFAKHRIAVDYGCDVSKEMGMQMLNRLMKIANNTNAKKLIRISLNDEFNQACNTPPNFTFRLDYIYQ